MTDTQDFADEFYDDMFPWRDTTPEEYIAHHWLEFGAFSVTRNNQFKNSQLKAWLTRFEEIFHSPDLIEECRQKYLTAEQLAAQQLISEKIDQNGF